MSGIFKLYQSPADSHKGQNGKLLVIGGSKLFHSSIFWSADVASRIVDLVHFTSPANENNELVRKKIKDEFWNGIVVDWKDVENYVEEDDCVLIGPGMIRGEANQGRWQREKGRRKNIEEWGQEDQTEEIVNYLLQKFPTKRWVIDGGALQEVEPRLMTESCILTPHKMEFDRISHKRPGLFQKGRALSDVEQCELLSIHLDHCTVLLKGQSDIVCQDDHCVQIPGGNPGMTKGGTGDILAGLVAALYCKNSSWTAATVGSFVNKAAGDVLYRRVGPYFNTEDLLQEIPKILWEVQDIFGHVQ